MLEEPISFEQFLSIPNALFKSIGMKAYASCEEKKGFTYLDFTFLINIFNLKLIFVLEILFVVVAFKTNTKIEEALMNLSFIGFVAVCVLKVLSVLRKKSQLTVLMIDLQKIYPNTAKEQSRYNIKQVLKDCNSRSIPFTVFSYILVWCNNLLPLVSYCLMDYWLGLREVGHVLPYHIYVPWAYQTHWSFFVLYALESLAGHTTMAGQLGADVMLFVVATHVIMHYRQLAKLIEEYKTGEQGYEKDLEFLKFAIEYHQKVLSLSEAINDIFGVSLLFNFVSSSLIICFLGFQMTININKDLFFIVVSFLSCNLVQVFFISRYGQELIMASEGVGHAVYNHDWHNADIRYKKMLVLFMERAQKTAILKATTFLNVSLMAMADLMQLSYKFFALLRTMYAE